MGFTWAASALAALGVRVAVPAMTASMAIAALLVLGARRLQPANAAVPASASSGVDLSNVRRRFNLIVLAEFAAIAAAVNVLSRLGHSRWIPAVVCAAVGLHFLPLARLFGVGLYYATAATLCLTAGATMVLGAIGAPALLCRIIPGFGAALALWATGAWLLVAHNTQSASERPTSRSSTTAEPAGIGLAAGDVDVTS